MVVHCSKYGATDDEANDAGDGLRRAWATLAARGSADTRGGCGEVRIRACRPAASAAPTCTCSTARWRRRRAAGARPPDRRHRGGDGEGAVGVPWLGWTCGECAYCRSGRENLCPRRALHGPRHRRRDGRVRGRRRAVLLPDPRRLPGPAGGPAAVRRADRLPRAAHVRRGAAARPLRVRGGRAHHRQVAVAQGAEVCAFTRPGDANAQAFAPSSARPWAGGSGRAVPCAAGRRDHLRPRGRTRSRRAAGAGARRASWSAAAST